MNRTIKFRGLTTNGEWVFGLLARKDNDWYISNSAGAPFAFQVRPETIGQFIELPDSYGKEIYEGDIAEYCEVDDHNHLLSNITLPILIEYNNAWAQFGWSDGGAWFELDHFRIKEVIGNIFENPELLK